MSNKISNLKKSYITPPTRFKFGALAAKHVSELSQNRPIFTSYPSFIIYRDVNKFLHRLQRKGEKNFLDGLSIISVFC